MAITTIIAVIAVLVFATGFLMSLWWVVAIGLLALALSGQYLPAIALAFVIDLLYGAPPGIFHFIMFPFTIAVLIVSLGMVFLKNQFREMFTDEFT